MKAITPCVNSSNRRFFLVLFLGAGFCGYAQSPPSSEVAEVEIPADESSYLPDNLSVLLAEGDGRYVYPQRLICGEVLAGLSGKKGDRILIPVEIGDEIRRVIIRMNGEIGDADLYVKRDEPPTLDSYDFRPYVEGNQEKVYLENPQTGIWFVFVHGYRDFEDVQISISCIQEELEENQETFLEQQNLELALYYELSVLENTNRSENLSLRGQVLNRRGRQAFASGRFDEALGIWREWMEVDPENTRPVSLLGDLYLSADEVDTAIDFYKRSLEMQPSQLVLLSRLARILDVQANRPEESRDLLNRFSRLFPGATKVSLAQAEWLIRRKRYEEAVSIIQKVIELDPENLNAMSLLHPLLRNAEQRYFNMMNMLRVGQLPGRETSLAFAVKDNDLLTKPESWVLMDFLDRMSGEAPTPEQRQLFSDLLPRDGITVEDFRIGRMSTNWISSREENWSEDGNLVLAADVDQTEAFLRLVRSDALHNGFVQAEIDDTRGFFWIYARRGQGNMIRFGFEESGQLYLQVWINNRLVTNKTRMWSREAGPASLRLETKGDGAMGYINGDKIFDAPVSIPDEMGLGWWGIAPWSAKEGTALVSVRKISGGPLPARILVIEQSTFNDLDVSTLKGSGSTLMDWLDQSSEGMSTMAPEWFEQTLDGDVARIPGSNALELQLLARYHRMRLLPSVRIHHVKGLNIEELSTLALEQKLDGFTFIVDRLPSPDWLEMIEAQLIPTGLTLHIIQLDRNTDIVSFRELSASVGIFPGPRRIHSYPLKRITDGEIPQFSDMDSSVVYLLDGDSL